MANPTLVPAYIDVTEYKADYAARKLMNPVEEKLKQLYEKFACLPHFFVYGRKFFQNSLEISFMAFIWVSSCVNQVVYDCNGRELVSGYVNVKYK